MKILHINYSDKSGGAGIAAYRHNEAMNRIGLNSNMLVVLKMTRIIQFMYCVKTEYNSKFWITYIIFSILL